MALDTNVKVKWYFENAKSKNIVKTQRVFNFKHFYNTKKAPASARTSILYKVKKMIMNGCDSRKPYSTRHKAVRTPENIRKIKNIRRSATSRIMKT